MKAFDAQMSSAGGLTVEHIKRF